MFRAFLYGIFLVASCHRLTVDPSSATSLLIINSQEKKLIAIITLKSNSFDTITIAPLDTTQLRTQRSNGWLTPSDMVKKISIVDSSFVNILGTISLNNDSWICDRVPKVKWYFLLK